MVSRVFDFDSERGHRLSGRLEMPEVTLRGWAILAHCFTCGKDGLAAARVARALARAGIGVLRFDFAGIGQSGGTLGEAGFAADVGDLAAASKAMAAAGMAPSLLVGHSLGGAAVLAAAGDMPEIAAVATIAAPSDVRHVLHQLDPEHLAKVVADGEAEVHFAGRPFTVRRSFVEDLERHDVEARIAELRRPLLVMHAPLDSVVGIDHASRIFQAAKHPKSFISLDTADHLLTRVEDANYAATMIAAWASRYLPQIDADLTEAEPAQGVTAQETGAGKFQVELRSGTHRLISDEPVAVGELGSGLSPHELVSAGLAACTVMTMRIYADFKGIPLEGAIVTVDHSKVSDMTPPDRFTRTIKLEGPLSEEQRGKLLHIADRCPVDLTLVRGADVETTLIDA